MLDENLNNIINDVIVKIQNTQLEIFQSANASLFDLYYFIGKIVNENAKWGNNFIDSLSKMLKMKFPEIKGFSPRNIQYMKKYYNIVKDNDELKEATIRVPWSHCMLILSSVEEDIKRLWYIQETYNNGWSYDYLDIQIKRDVYSRQVFGDKPNNFKNTLLSPQSELAHEIMKDPYIFDVGQLRENFKEKDIENAMIERIKMTLLELGTGFSFISNQYRVVVNDEENYIDLLFYHTKLHCYIAIELKNGKFIPEYIGKMNYYLSVLDDTLKMKSDNPSIGIILVRDKDKLNVEYALRDVNKPIGVSTYQLAEYLPIDALKQLPKQEILNYDLDIKD